MDEQPSVILRQIEVGIYCLQVEGNDVNDGAPSTIARMLRFRKNRMTGAARHSSTREELFVAEEFLRNRLQP
jgi:hypothetical protein